AAPYVKAEYNKCSWGQKCPTLQYRLLYKPIYKVAHKTVTELEWRCCPGYSGYGCMEGHSAYHPPMKFMPPFKGQPKGPPPSSINSYPMRHFGPPIETEERLDRMEEDVHRLNQGLETLRGTMNGLEDSLRASLREDANRMLSALLSATPGPVPAPALATSHSEVGFGDIPAGDPESEGLDGRHVFSGLGELSGRLEELRAELQAKTAELQELRSTVMGHDGVLKKLSHGAKLGSGANGTQEGDTQKAMEKLVDAKLSGARTEILGGFEKHVENSEGRCEEKAGEVHRQCQREQAERQEQLEEALDGSTMILRTELRNLQAQIHDLKATNGCCGRMNGLAERVQLLEVSVTGLNQSQGHLRVELGGHKDHIEGMLEGRLGYVEAKLNLTGKTKSAEMGGRSTVSERGETVLEARLEGKLKALEGRLLAAVEELGNATAPALLEGHAVPTLETELEVQKHLNSLEILCSSSCSSPSTSSAIQGDDAASSADLLADENMRGMLDTQVDRLNSLNTTLQDILSRLTFRDQQEGAKGEPSVQEELTILAFNVRSVNRTLKGLQDSMGLVVSKVGQANSTWHEREARLAQQMKGMVQLVGRQASMLGSGERRLTRLKSELQEMKRRLAGELQGCRSTALGVKKEVIEVGGRVASVEDQCKSLNHMTEDLERIREELERQSDGLLSQVNGTLSSHAQQLSDLRDGLKNCTTKMEPTQQSVELEPEQRRGDTFTLI
uniref:Elastin microfibril interfacer 3a n=1 Tax=Myripristis murdjan TaxID=586833 RepID=A0A667X0K9_9TELE